MSPRSVTPQDEETGAVRTGSKPLVYIAGPYTHPDPVLNVRRAVQIADHLASDIIPVIPHLTMLWHLISPQPVEVWYQRDLEILERCDALIRFDGVSPGADREVVFAIDHKIPVFHYDDEDFGYEFGDFQRSWSR